MLLPPHDMKKMEFSMATMHIFQSEEKHQFGIHICIGASMYQIPRVKMFQY
jgi:hypothetical protein